MSTAANITKVRFSSAEAGVDLVGDLYAPLVARADSAAFVIIGPMTFQKEQAPTQYARRFAAMGHTALVFDTRYRGESGGDRSSSAVLVIELAISAMGIGLQDTPLDRDTGGRQSPLATPGQHSIRVAGPPHALRCLRHARCPLQHGCKLFLAAPQRPVRAWAGWKEIRPWKTLPPVATRERQHERAPFPTAAAAAAPRRTRRRQHVANAARDIPLRPRR